MSGFSTKNGRSQRSSSNKMYNARMRAVVLAAGEGRRMGGSKALLVVDARALVVQHLQRLAELGCASIAIVVRPDVAWLVSRLLEKAAEARLFANGVDVRVIAAATSSQAASLAAGLATWRSSIAPASARDPASARARDVVLVAPVDMRPASLATLRALTSALQADEAALAATPTCGGRGGHPVAARAQLLAAYDVASTERSGAPPSLRDVLASAGARRIRVEVGDETILDDLDEPADLAGLDVPLRFAGAHCAV
jgi:CTP:molybdopterin cytidylyltransferase MocA